MAQPPKGRKERSGGERGARKALQSLSPEGLLGQRSGPVPGSQEYVLQQVAKALGSENGILNGRLRELALDYHGLIGWLRTKHPGLKLPPHVDVRRSRESVERNFQPIFTHCRVDLLDREGRRARLEKTVYLRLVKPLTRENAFVTEPRFHADGCAADAELSIACLAKAPPRDGLDVGALERAAFSPLKAEGPEPLRGLPPHNRGTRLDYRLRVDPSEFKEPGTYYRKRFACALADSYTGAVEYHAITAQTNDERKSCRVRLDIGMGEEYEGNLLFALHITAKGAEVNPVAQRAGNGFRVYSAEAPLEDNQKIILFWQRLVP